MARPRRSVMRDLMAELKELRLHGMATAWAELTAQGESNTASSKWLLEHLLEQEHTDRAMRSVSHQMNMAKLPMHRDLAGFDFSASSADARLISELANLSFYRHRAERGADRRPRHRQNPPGHRTGRVRHHPAWQARALLLHGRSGQSSGARKTRRQSRADRPGTATHGSGHPRRAGVSALQSGRWRAVISPAVQAVRAHQRGDHHQPELCRMVERVRRRQDDHSLAGSAYAPLPHRRNR
ncbi:transposase [Pseudomonas marincola]|uniref:Transposase n=1 Tax=Pseudomonas marincola TaxID=437900 RepID=A0A8S2BD92_9PSED|nr:transposase [Pseudomonas marincola]